MYRWSLLLMLLVHTVVIHAQPVKKITTEEYIEQYRSIAIHEMYRTGIPASIKLAQGILESGSGNSRLAQEANNHFGIKCHKGWNGESVYEDDDAPNECFRKYADPTTSYLDHSEFLQTRDRYAFLFDFDKTDYKRWAHGLKKAGYATNPKYAPLLIGLIERYNLHQYDLSGPVDEPILATEELEEYPGEEITIYPAGIIEVNRADAVFLQQGQSVATMAETYKLPARKLKKWNDLDLGYTIQPGMHFFLQPKRNKGAIKYHRVAQGETVYAISQQYGIKIDKLYKRNLLMEGQEPAVGQRLFLRGKRDNPPKLQAKAASKAGKKQPKPTMSHPAEAPAEIVATTANPAKVEASDRSTAPLQGTATNEPDNPYATLQDPVTPDNRPADPTASESPGEQEVTGSGNDNRTVRSVEPGDTKDTLRHTVTDGDTLYSLSRTYGIAISQLQEWNQLPDNNIHIGQSIIVGQPK